MPKVSIIVPIYNSEKYLDRCVSSLVNQTLTDIEIILVSDASPDNSKEIMERYARKDSRVVTIYNEVNGYPNPRNAGILAAKANYLGFVDADDWVELDMYEKLYAKTNNESVDVVISDLRKVNENGEIVNTEKLYDISLFGSVNNKQKIIDVFAVHGGRLYTNIWKKNTIVENNLFFLENNHYCDSIVNLWYLASNTFAKVDKFMYNYYQNTSSITHKYNNARTISDRPYAAEDMFKRSKSNGIYSTYKDVLDYRFYTLFLHNSFYIFSTRYTWPQYNVINDLKKRFHRYIPVGIKNNKYYIQDAFKFHKKRCILISMNTYIGATILWIVNRKKN